MNPIRMVELFAGIGAQASALRRIGVPFTSVVCEIDDKAYKAYCAVHGPTPNLGDITKVEHLPDCDLVTYSYPCTSVSVAGKREGMKEGSGTASSLLWEVNRLLLDAKERNVLPGVLVMENVEAVLFKENRPEFNRFRIGLDRMGYDSSYAVLNAKDFGVPQNRRRIFMVSTLDKGHFIFPTGWPLTKRLRDVLEDDVPESYYLSDERIAKYQRFADVQTEKGNGFGWHSVDIERERVSGTITTSMVRGNHSSVYIKKTEGRREDGVIFWPKGDKELVEAHPYDGLKVLPKPHLPGSSGTVQPQQANTLNTSRGCGAATVIPSAIRVAGDLNDPRRYESANRVHDADGICPALPCGTGGGIIPKIESVGFLGERTQHKTVYGVGGISPTLVACDWKDPVKIELKGTEPIGRLDSKYKRSSFVYGGGT